MLARDPHALRHAAIPFVFENAFGRTRRTEATDPLAVLLTKTVGVQTTTVGWQYVDWKLFEFFGRYETAADVGNYYIDVYDDDKIGAEFHSDS